MPEELTLNYEKIEWTHSRAADDNGAGLRSDGELVQAVSGDADGFDFAGIEPDAASGFSDVSGLGFEVTVVEYHEGAAHTPEWTDHTDADPAGGTYHPDSEWRYVPVRRTQAEDDGDASMLWDDGLF